MDSRPSVRAAILRHGNPDFPAIYEVYRDGAEPVRIEHDFFNALRRIDAGRDAPTRGAAARAAGLGFAKAWPCGRRDHLTPLGEAAVDAIEDLHLRDRDPMPAARRRAVRNALKLLKALYEECEMPTDSVCERHGVDPYRLDDLIAGL